MVQLYESPALRHNGISPVMGPETSDKLQQRNGKPIEVERVQLTGLTNAHSIVETVSLMGPASLA